MYSIAIIVPFDYGIKNNEVRIHTTYPLGIHIILYMYACYIAIVPQKTKATLRYDTFELTSQIGCSLPFVFIRPYI